MNAIDTRDAALTLRSPPYNEEAEIQLLGAILANNSAYHMVSEFLRPEHFGGGVHQRIFEAIKKLMDRNLLASPVTLRNYFQQDGELEQIGGVEYLVKLAKAAVTIINAADHGRIVYDLYLRRQLIAVGEEVINRAYAHDLDTPATDIQSWAVESLEQSAPSVDNEGQGPTLVEYALEDAYQAAEAASQSPDHLTGLTTTLGRLDAKTGGLQKGELVIAAGRPSMGKSSLARQIAWVNAARYQEFDAWRRQYCRSAEDEASWDRPRGCPVLFFNLEMSKRQIGQMEMASHLGIPSDVQRKGKAGSLEIQSMVKFRIACQGMPLWIDDRGGLTMAQIRATARRWKRKHGVGLIIVDYLQLATIDQRGERRYEGREKEIGAISRGLKKLAKELDVPVLALSQLSRAVEQREDKRPQLADLRESGTIEQDADVVWLLYRDHYYIEREEPNRRSNEREDAFNNRLSLWTQAEQAARGKAEIFVGKQRMGPVGKVMVGFEDSRARFTNIES